MKQTLIIAVVLFLTCSNAAAQGAWTKKTDFAGAARTSAVGFSIGNKGYIGFGSIINIPTYKDFWEYDPILDSWTQKADFGANINIAFAVGFSIGIRGYVGTGIMNNTSTQQFWEWVVTFIFIINKYLNVIFHIFFIITSKILK